MNVYVNKTAAENSLYLKQQVIFQDPLDWLKEIGAQREGALQSSLPIPEELGQSLTPHAVSQCCH